jgi:sugar phosphate isomerase/epimerase
MQSLKPLEAGVMFWAGRDALADVRSTGVRCGQLGLPGGMELTDAAAAQWRQDLDAAGFTIVTVVASYEGESYADIPTVQRTVGFIPPATRAEREARTDAVSDFAAKLGVKSIACHIGFVPEDEADPDYLAVRDVVRRICDHAAVHGQTFALETGQERADVLLRFLADCARPNLGINFDPANLILYGTGEPIEALRMLAPHVISVHAKDGDWPPKDVPGALGSERALGQGSVGIDRFVGTLNDVGFRGTLNVEREGAAAGEWLKDVNDAVRLLTELTARL